MSRRMGGSIHLYERIYGVLKGEISTGVYQPGDLFPPEQELMTRFGVSRMTTNRALQLLAAEGYIVRRAGVGTFVGETWRQRACAIRTPAQSAPPEPTVAASLVSHARSVRQIGFVIPFLGQSFGTELLAHVERELQERAMTLSVACSLGSQETEEQVVQRLLASGVQGLIVFPVNGTFYNPAILRLHVDHFPLVVVDKKLPGIPVPFVTSDNERAAHELTEHLLHLGHRAIAFFSPERDGTSTLCERYDAFVAAHNEQGIDHPTDYDLSAIPWNAIVDGLDQDQVRDIANFLDQHPEVTAAFATDDQLAEHWLEAARQTGRRVPEDLSIVCFDGRPPRKAHWSFTCALQDQPAMAHAAVTILCALLDGGESPETATATSVPTRLHVGHSTGPAPDPTPPVQPLGAATAP
ncbi:MAG: GntR family transcriptional regulator [Firmicutes bacterium]|nr:GntR family transcriptional regulator [Bacillota bacterium]